MSTKIYRYDLKKLVQFVDKKNVAVPEFQRGYVWAVKQVKKLFDSLVNHYPIGSFIVWETTQKIDARTINGEKLSKQKYLLLDGQQRLLSLFYLCKQTKFLQVKDKFHEICDVRQGNLVDFELFHIDWENRELILNYSKGKSCEFDYKKFQKLLGKGYKFPVIIVSLDNYKHAIQIFERINQAGTRISTESIFLSEAWNKNSNIGRVLREWKSEHKGSLTSNIDTVIFIHAFAIIFQLEKKEKDDSVEVGVTVLKKIAEVVSRETLGKYSTQFKEVVKSVARAVEYLKEDFGITKLTELPSQTMITILSVFFYYQKRPINKTQETELRKWFWRSSLDNRYIGSGYTKNIGYDAKRMKNLALKSTGLFLPTIKLGFSKFYDVDLRSGRSTLRNIVRQALWQQKPVFIDERPIIREDVESGQHKPEDDHFFPFDLKRKGIADNYINNILNINFLNGNENVKKGKQLPSVWLEKRIADLKLDKEDVCKYFKSQLLPFDSIQYLRKRERFMQIRSKKARQKEFERIYWRFLKRRFWLLEKALNKLQNGK